MEILLRYCVHVWNEMTYLHSGLQGVIICLFFVTERIYLLCLCQVEEPSQIESENPSGI